MHIFIDFWKLGTENSFLHVFSFLHKLSFENSFCFLSIFCCQTSFLVSKNRKLFLKTENKRKKQLPNIPLFSFFSFLFGINVRDHVPDPFYRTLDQTHVNGWSCIIVSQNRGSTSYISPFRLRVLQWSRYLFN